MPGGRKTKFTEENVAIILAAIEKEGTDKAGYQAIGIHHDTFYVWVNEKPEFAAQVKRSRRKYSDTRDLEVRKKVRANVQEYAVNGTDETWRTTEVTKDEKGRVVSTKEKVQVVNRKASWAIDRVLGQPMNELDAVKLLVENNWLPQEKLAKIQRRLEAFEKDVKAILAGDYDEP